MSLSTVSTRTDDPAATGLERFGDGTVWADAEYRRVLGDWGAMSVDAIMGSCRGRCLRKLDDRENWFLPTPGGLAEGLYLKKHHARKKGPRIHIGPPERETPAFVEAQNIGRLTAAGIGTMRLVAYGQGISGRRRGESFVLTEALDGYEPLDDFVEARFPNGIGEDRNDFYRLIDAVSDLARRFHAAGFNHRDFYCCHFFVKEEGGRFEIRLIDLQRMQYRRSRRRRWIVKDLAQLAYSAPSAAVDCKAKVRFLKGYFGVRKLGPARKRLAKAVFAKQRYMEWKLGKGG